MKFEPPGKACPPQTENPRRVPFLHSLFIGLCAFLRVIRCDVATFVAALKIHVTGSYLPRLIDHTIDPMAYEFNRLFWICA